MIRTLRSFKLAAQVIGSIGASKLFTCSLVPPIVSQNLAIGRGLRMIVIRIHQAAATQQNADSAEPGLHFRRQGADHAAQAGAVNAQAFGIDFRPIRQPGGGSADIEHGLPNVVDGLGEVCRHHATFGAGRPARSIVGHLHEQGGNLVLGQAIGDQPGEILIARR